MVFWALFAVAVQAPGPFHIASVEPFVARTCMLHWHSEYTLREMDSNFVDMIAPSRRNARYYACCSNDIVRCIVLCRRHNQKEYIEKIACHPDYEMLPPLAMRALVDGFQCGIDWNALKKQPVWFAEASFYLNS